jgi:hypothetical protein
MGVDQVGKALGDVGTEELLAELWKRAVVKDYSVFVRFSDAVCHAAASSVFRLEGREMDYTTALTDQELVKRRILATSDLQRKKLEAEELRRKGGSWRQVKEKLDEPV